MKICHNCGRELENAIVNCIRCNVEQLKDAVIFKAKPKPPPEVRATKTQLNEEITPTSPAPPYVQQGVVDNSGLVSPFDSSGTATATATDTNENLLDATTFDATAIDSNIDEILDDIISDEVERAEAKQQNSTNATLLVLLVLVFIIIIMIVQPYIKEAISATKPVYTDVTSVAPVTDNAELVTQIDDHENGVSNGVSNGDGSDNGDNGANNGNDDGSNSNNSNDNAILEGTIDEQFPEFGFINKTIHELNEFYDGEDNQSTQSILGNDYLVQISTDIDYVITNINYTSNYNATTETLNESISKINQISDFFTQGSQATSLGSTDTPLQSIKQLTLENLTQAGFVNETFKSSYAIDGDNIVTITVVCTFDDGVYTLTNSIDFEESSFELSELLTAVEDTDEVEILTESENIVILNDAYPTESPYTHSNDLALTLS